MSGLRGRDKQQGDLVDAEAGKGELPEGLQRKPVGPKSVGTSDKDRERNEQTAESYQEQQIPSPGEPAGGE